MSLLDQIIDGSIDDNVSTENLLRRALIVASRLEATDLSTWISSELNGFRGLKDVRVPKYRGPFRVPVIGVYMGYGSRANNVPLEPLGVEDWFVNVMFSVTFLEPVAELGRMTDGQGQLTVTWTPSAIGTWNEWEVQHKVSGMEDMSLVAAQKSIPRTVVSGILSSVRNRLLEMALDLRSSNPDAGEKGGPTVADAEISQTVVHITNNVYGPGANIAIGQGATQNMTIAVGDIDALISGAQQAGLHDPDALAELAAAASSDDKPSRLSAFMTKLGDGGFKAVGDVASKVAVQALTTLVEQYLGVK